MAALMVMLAVFEPEGWQPIAAMAYVIVYDPGVLAAGLMTPVELLMDRPAVELNVPPMENPPASVGDWLPAVVHTGDV